MNTVSKWCKQKVVLQMRLRCGSLSITTPVSLLANEFDVLSLLQGQVSLAPVSQIYVFHEAMNSCKKSIDSLKTYIENVNIRVCCSEFRILLKSLKFYLRSNYLHYVGNLFLPKDISASKSNRNYI